MTPKFSLAVDPFLLHCLNLLDRIGSGQEPNPQEERIRMRVLLENGQAIVGASSDWDLASYALVAWIDEMLVEANWTHREWWSNNVMEREMFNSRDCAERFFVNAKEASTNSMRDVLEVYYVCVILGFRGFYSEPNLASMLSSSLSLPGDIKNWARQVAMSIRLGQGRPTLSAPQREVAGAPPLAAKNRVVWPWLIASMLAAWNVLYFFLIVSR